MTRGPDRDSHLHVGQVVKCQRVLGQAYGYSALRRALSMLAERGRGGGAVEVLQRLCAA